MLIIAKKCDVSSRIHFFFLPAWTQLKWGARGGGYGKRAGAAPGALCGRRLSLSRPGIALRST